MNNAVNIERFLVKRGIMRLARITAIALLVATLVSTVACSSNSGQTGSPHFVFYIAIAFLGLILAIVIALIINMRR